MKRITTITIGLAIFLSPLYGQETGEALLVQAGTDGSGGTSVDPCAQGTMDADMVETGMWTNAGLAGGLACSCIGCGGVWYFANSSNPQPPAYKMVDMSPQDQMIYTQCYQARAKQKASSAALMGGAVGVLAGIALNTRRCISWCSCLPRLLTSFSGLKPSCVLSEPGGSSLTI